MDSMDATTGSLSAPIKDHVWQGGKNFHLILFNLIISSSHSCVPNWRETKVKEALRVSFAFFVVSPLCLFHSSPPYPLPPQWTLCALWPLNDYFFGILAFTFFTSIWNLSLNSCLTTKQLFDPLSVLFPPRSGSFTAQSKKLNLGGGQA